MKTLLNVGSLDRVARLVLGVILFVLAFGILKEGAGAVITGILGAIMLATGSMGMCPLYYVLDINTDTPARG
jgi:hypothetical protein